MSPLQVSLERDIKYAQDLALTEGATKQPSKLVSEPSDVAMLLWRGALNKTSLALQLLSLLVRLPHPVFYGGVTLLFGSLPAPLSLARSWLFISQ